MMKDMTGFFRSLKQSKGFTLIELLIVITIIGIMAALIGTNFLRSQKTARDAYRKSQVKAVQDAMEQFYSANGTYTNGCTAANLSLYLPGGLPVDPNGAGTITCTVTGGGASYCVLANPLEITGTGTCDASCNFVTGGTGFCLKNLQ